MKYKYFSTWFALNEETELNEDSLEKIDLYYRFFYESQLNCMVGQRFLNENFDLVFYTGENIEKINVYHNENFEGINLFQVLKNLSDSSILTKFYVNNQFQGMELYNYDFKYQYVRNHKFDQNYQLTEYREAIYTSDQTLQKEKIFIPSLWQTFEEDY